MADSAANLDAQICAQQDSIEAEIASTQPLVGDVEPWSNLEEEYTGNEAFQAHIVSLGKSYGSLRRVRKDGNCFYRAFLFSYLEYLSKKPEELATFRKLVSDLAESMVRDGGYQSYIIQDMHEPFDEVLASLNNPDFSLQEALNEVNYSNYYIAFLRVIVSYQLQKEEEFFQNFIVLGEDAVSIRDFCSKEVEPMAKESDNIQLIGLARAFYVCFRVESCDPRSQWQQLFAPESDQEQIPVLTLLFKPGHYDIIYSKQQ